MMRNETVTPAAQTTDKPCLSLLIPAHSAQGCLPELVKRLLSQSSYETPIEIIISSDDGYDYSGILPSDKRVVYAESGVNTGPANARNRALKAATGSHACMMDADDSVSGLFLATVFKALEKHSAFAIRSVYVRDGAAVRAYLAQHLTLSSYARFYGSVLVVAPRHSFPAFQNVVVEDGVASLAIMHRFGGSLPVVNAEYRINLHSGSFCATNGHTFSRRYREHLESVEVIASNCGDITLAPILKHLYETRLEMSLSYDRYLSAGGEADYHDFVLMQIDEISSQTAL